jgi:hypothetical protein
MTTNSDFETGYRNRRTDMAFVRSDRDYRQSRPNKSETLEFRLIFAVTFAVFLVAGLLECLLPLRWLSNRVARGQDKSIIERAADGARTCATYAFMG